MQASGVALSLLNVRLVSLSLENAGHPGTRKQVQEMAVTRDSLGLTEAAQVERQPVAGPRRADFPVGSYVRARNPLLDTTRDIPLDLPQLDVGQVRETHLDGEFVAVRWAQTPCGGDDAMVSPANLVKLTEAEYHLFVVAYHAGYNIGWDAAAAPTKPVWPN